MEDASVGNVSSINSWPLLRHRSRKDLKSWFLNLTTEVSVRGSGLCAMTISRETSEVRSSWWENRKTISTRRFWCLHFHKTWDSDLCCLSLGIEPLGGKPQLKFNIPTSWLHSTWCTELESPCVLVCTRDYEGICPFNEHLLSSDLVPGTLLNVGNLKINTSWSLSPRGSLPSEKDGLDISTSS